MTREEIIQAAIECLVKAFKGQDVPPHVAQAAVSITMAYGPGPHTEAG